MRAADTDTPTLPEDPAALRALLLEALNKVDTLIAERDVLSSRCDSVAAERDALVEQNERLRHLLLKLRPVQRSTAPNPGLSLGIGPDSYACGPPEPTCGQSTRPALPLKPG